MHPYDVLVNRQLLLNKNDIPRDLVKAKIPFAPGTEDYKQYMRLEAAKWVSRLFQRAEAEGIELVGVSGYRSYERQKQIYTQSLKEKGKEHTDKYIAPPGGSEHQTGLALDISCKRMDYQLEAGFASAPEGKWLHSYASLYGFVMRYPENKENITGYAYEPWHIRYVTKPLAFYLTKTEKTLEEYHELNSLI